MLFEIVCIVLIFLFIIMSADSQKKRKREESQQVNAVSEKAPRKVFAKINHKKTEVSSNWKSFLKTAPVEEKPKFKPKHHNNWLNNKGKAGKMQVTQSEEKSNGQSDVQDNPTSRPVVLSNRLTKHVAMDCEMVGDEDNGDILARVSIVNKFGECVYDKYVKPTHPVADYRTWVSGIRPRDLQNGESLETVQKEVADIIKGKILVGHAIRNDLKVLFLSHPQRMIRDTQRFKPFKTVMNTKRPSLKKLASHVLGIQIQEGEHSSVEDAKATMQLYLMYQKQWEKELSMMRLKSKKSNENE